MTILDFIEDNQEIVEEVFLEAGFRECEIEFDEDRAIVRLVKNTRQAGEVTVEQDGSFDGPAGIGWNRVCAAMREVERLYKNEG